MTVEADEVWMDTAWAVDAMMLFIRVGLAFGPTSIPTPSIAVDLTIDSALPGVRISSIVKTTGQTGVEMEALTAVSTAALTVYDMLKAVDRGMEIGGIHVTLKDGGKSGRYEATR